MAQDKQMSDISNGVFVWLKSAESSQPFSHDIRNSLAGSEHWEIGKAFRTNEDPLNRIWAVQGFESRDSLRLWTFLNGLSYVVFVENMPVFEWDHTPNDLQKTQWGLRKVNAESAWDLGKGSKSVVVALIDDGLDTAHADLQPVIWHNVKEIPGNKLDDDGNGWTDDYFGWDVADNDNDPSVTVSNKLSHGTHCAGLINSATNNSKGIAGLGYQARIMAIKCGQNGSKLLSNPYKGVDYAIANGADVISMSWGSKTFSYTYSALFATAWKRGIFCVAAAGNTVYKGDDTVKRYPAAYEYVMSVGATDSLDKRSYFSCNGDWVDVMAPGSDIISTLPGNQYGYMDGTSMACPMVAGLAALMWARNPLQKVNEVWNCILDGCVNIDSLNTGYSGKLGAGRIDAARSMSCIKMVRALFDSDKRRVCTGDTVHYYDQSLGSPMIRKWYFEGGTPSVSNQTNPKVQYSTDGTYKVKLVVSDGTFFDSIEYVNYISTGKPTLKFSGNQTITAGDYGTITAELTGYGPWDIQYTDGKDTFQTKNIRNSPYFILVSRDSNVVFKPVAVFESGCSGQVSDSFVLTVLKKGITLCDSAIRFRMRWGGTSDEEVYRIAVYDDTTFVIAGRTKSYGSGNYSSFLAMITTGGQRKWFKTYGGSSEDGFYALVIDKNKDIHAGGYTFSGTTGKSIYWIKTDKNGNLLWKKHYDGSSWELIRNGIISRNKKWIYYGGPSISNSYGSEDFTLVKMDTAGNVSWVKQIGDSEFNRNDGIWEDSTGNLYVVGYQGNNYPYLDAILTKLDTSGKVLFTKKYNFTTSGYNETFEKIAVWKERAIFAFGFAGQYNGSYSTQETWLTRLDTGGSVVWAKKYTLGTGNVGGMEIVGDHIYVTANSSNNGGDILLMKLDTNGNVLNAQLLGNSSLQNSWDIVKTTDGGFYISGHDRTSGSNDLLIAKGNCRLDFLCEAKSATPTVNAMAVTVSNFTFSSRNFNTGKTVNLTAGTYTPNISYVCKSKDYRVRNQCDLNAEFQIIPACTGEPVGFKDLSEDLAGYTIKQHLWDFGDSSTASGQQNITHVYTEDGAYKVRLIVRSESGQYACLDTVEYMYHSKDSFRIKKMIPNSTICFNDSIQLGKVLFYCGESPFYYTWYPSYGISDTTSDMPYFSPKKKTTYYVRVRDDNGVEIIDSFVVDINYQCCVSVPRFSVKDNHACEKEKVFFVNESTNKKNAVFKWVFSGASIASYTGFEPPGITYNTSGVYPVKLILNDSCVSDTLESEIFIAAKPVAFTGRDTALCMPDTVRLGQKAMDWYGYEWTPATGMQNPYVADPVVVVSKPVTYYLRVISDEGCTATDSISITRFSSKPDLGPDTTICSDDSLFLSGGVTGEKYRWNTGDTTYAITSSVPGIYILNTINKTCIYSDTLVLNVDTIPYFSLGNDTAICKVPGELKLNSTIPESSYNSAFWDNGDSGFSRTVNSPGTYWFRVEKNRCTFTDSIVIQFDDKPEFSLGNDSRVCLTLSGIAVNAAGNIPVSSQYLWNTGAQTDNIVIFSGGLYWLKITNGTCTTTDSIIIQVDSMPSFTLGRDTQICITELPLHIQAGDIRVPSAQKVWDDGSSGNDRWVSDGGYYWLQMENGICVFRDSILLLVDTVPVFSLGKDTAICESAAPLTIGPGSTMPGWKYEWSHGAGSAQTSVNVSGDYRLTVKNGTCADDDTIRVKIFESPAFTLGADTQICKQDFPFNLQPLNLVSPVTSYLWDDGSANAQRQVMNSGTYLLTVMNGKCDFSDSITLDTLSRPFQNLGADTQICLGDTLKLQATVYPVTNYEWNQGATGTELLVLNSGIYRIEATNKCGVEQDEIEVREKDCSCPVYIPNSFTPGRSSQLNDVFSVVLDCPVDEFEIQIYNRWGNLLFKSTDTSFAWDGRAGGERVPAGAYYGIVRIKSKRENGGREYYRTGVIYVLE